MANTGAFSEVAHYAGEAALQGLKAKETEKLNELNTLLNKIEDVANKGYLSPYADEFYPEIRGMTYKDKLKVINDTVANIGNKNIQDIVREMGYWGLEKVTPIIPYLGRTASAGNFKIPDWYNDRYLKVYNVFQIPTKILSDKKISTDKINEIKNYSAYKNASRLPGADLDVATRVDNLILLYGKRPDLWRNLAQEYDPMYDTFFIKKEKEAEQDYLTGRINEQDFEDKMAQIYSAKLLLKDLGRSDFLREAKEGGLGPLGGTKLLETPAKYSNLPEDQVKKITDKIYFTYTGKLPETSKERTPIGKAGEIGKEVGENILQGVHQTMQQIPNLPPPTVPEEEKLRKISPFYNYNNYYNYYNNALKNLGGK